MQHPLKNNIKEETKNIFAIMNKQASRNHIVLKSCIIIFMLRLS